MSCTLKVVARQCIEFCLTDAMIPEYICRHIAKNKAAIVRYKIASLQYMFNIEESGYFFFQKHDQPQKKIQSRAPAK